MTSSFREDFQRFDRPGRGGMNPNPAPPSPASTSSSQQFGSNETFVQFGSNDTFVQEPSVPPSPVSTMSSQLSVEDTCVQQPSSDADTTARPETSEDTEEDEPDWV